MYQSSQVYQDCTNSVPMVYQSKDSQNSKNDHSCTNRHMSKDSQNSKIDHWCTNRHMQVCQDCTNSVTTVCQSSKTVKQQKNDHWSTNRHMSTQSPPNTQSPRLTCERGVSRSHVEFKKARGLTVTGHRTYANRNLLTSARAQRCSCDVVYSSAQ